MSGSRFDFWRSRPQTSSGRLVESSGQLSVQVVDLQESSAGSRSPLEDMAVQRAGSTPGIKKNGKNMAFSLADNEAQDRGVKAIFDKKPDASPTRSFVSLGTSDVSSPYALGAPAMPTASRGMRESLSHPWVSGVEEASLSARPAEAGVKPDHLLPGLPEAGTRTVPLAHAAAEVGKMSASHKRVLMPNVSPPPSDAGPAGPADAAGAAAPAQNPILKPFKVTKVDLRSKAFESKFSRSSIEYSASSKSSYDEEGMLADIAAQFQSMSASHKRVLMPNVSPPPSDAGPAGPADAAGAAAPAQNPILKPFKVTKVDLRSKAFESKFSRSSIEYSASSKSSYNEEGMLADIAAQFPAFINLAASKGQVRTCPTCSLVYYEDLADEVLLHDFCHNRPPVRGKRSWLSRCMGDRGGGSWDEDHSFSSRGSFYNDRSGHGDFS